MDRRRGFRGLAAALVAAAGLTACSAGGNGRAAGPGGIRAAKGQEPCKIVLWHYYNDLQKESLDQIIEEYNQTEGAEKGITVEAYSQGSITELSNKMDLIVNDSTNQVGDAQHVHGIPGYGQQDLAQQAGAVGGLRQVFQPGGSLAVL